MLAGMIKAFEVGPFDEKLSSVCSFVAIAGVFRLASTDVEVN